MDSVASIRAVLNRLPGFVLKPESLKQRICESVLILSKLGIPVDGSPRQLERMGMAFMAVADVTAEQGWSQAKDAGSGRSLRSRDIIAFENNHFEEKMSPGSYDDIRRQDLLQPREAEIVIGTKPGSARNSPARGFALNPEFAGIVRAYGQVGWDAHVQNFMASRITLTVRLTSHRNLTSTSVILPSGKPLNFGPGTHNELQKAIIEKFLPKFGYGAEVLYVGDAEHRALINETDRLRELGFFELGHGELPDVVAFSAEKNWLFIIEAVATVNPIDQLRKMKLEELTADCKVPIVYVTAFPTPEGFAKNAAKIAWETEVWIASNPDHMIHYNGPKFLGPYTGEAPA